MDLNQVVGLVISAGVGGVLALYVKSLFKSQLVKLNVVEEPVELTVVVKPQIKL